MDNFKGHGDRIDHTVSGAAATSGEPRAVGTNLLGVALNDAAIGETTPYAIEGVFELPKVSAAVITIGEQVTWDESADAIEDEAHTIAAGDFRCGTAMETKGASTTTVKVKINTVVDAA